MPPTSTLMDTPTKKVVVATLVTVLTSGGIFTLLDSRYALASEIQDIHAGIDRLTSAIGEDRIERLELNIKQSERRINLLLLVSNADRSDIQKQSLLFEQDSKQKYIRKLERLTNPAGIQ